MNSSFNSRLGLIFRLIAIFSMCNQFALAESINFNWSTVVNNGDFMPTDQCDPNQASVPPCRVFNSYNQPSVNARGVVVFRARSRGGKRRG